MSELKTKRLVAGISGSLLCAKAGISRSRLCLIERGYVVPAPDELARLTLALEQLIQAKSVIKKVAASLGWPLLEDR